MGESRWVHLDFDEILRETEKAFLIRIDDEEYWIPFSQIADPEEYREGDTDGEISITEWIAREKGLE